jgi:hypothetical protein
MATRALVQDVKYRLGFTKQASRERQFSRWLHNPKIVVLDLYALLFKFALLHLTDTEIYLAFDTSQLFDRIEKERVYNLIHRLRT